MPQAPPPSPKPAGRTLPGLLLTAPSGWRQELENALCKWAQSAGYRVHSADSHRILLKRGTGLLSGRKTFRWTVIEETPQLVIELAPAVPIFPAGYVGTDAVFFGVLATSSLRQDRDALLTELLRHLPALESTPTDCRVGGLPGWLSAVLMSLMLLAILSAVVVTLHLTVVR